MKKMVMKNSYVKGMMGGGPMRELDDENQPRRRGYQIGYGRRWRRGRNGLVGDRRKKVTNRFLVRRVGLRSGLGSMGIMGSGGSSRYFRKGLVRSRIGFINNTGRNGGQILGVSGRTRRGILRSGRMFYQNRRRQPLFLHTTQRMFPGGTRQFRYQFPIKASYNIKKRSLGRQYFGLNYVQRNTMNNTNSNFRRNQKFRNTSYYGSSLQATKQALDDALDKYMGEEAVKCRLDNELDEYFRRNDNKNDNSGMDITLDDGPGNL